MTLRELWPFRERSPRRIVIKIGSNVLALANGGINRERVGEICGLVASLMAAGIEVIVVSSGAVASGLGVLQLAKRPTEIPELQAVAAIGQGVLVEEYNAHLRRHNLAAAQMLLTYDDMEDRRRYLNAKHALAALIRHRAVPIINENDTVTIDELKFGDNDMLSAMVAAKMDADLLLILSTVPGLMSGRGADASTIPVVKKIDAGVEELVFAGKSTHGTGGMRSKLEAARHATRFGVAVAVLDGCSLPDAGALLAGGFVGTLFLPQGSRRAGRGRIHWISARRPRGTIIIDAGAAKAVRAGKSLLAVGIRSVRGNFTKGDVIEIIEETAGRIATGVANYDAGSVSKIAGLKGAEIAHVLGEVNYREVVHRDHMLLVEEAE